MERLTFKDGYGRWTLLVNGFPVTGPVVDRLAAYEETGFEPQEIKRSDDLLRGFIDLSRRHARTLPWMENVMIADGEGRLHIDPPTKLNPMVPWEAD